MNLRMTIPVLLAAWLSGCDSSSTSLAGTSSETVTGLQILANSAETIVSKIGESKGGVAARADSRGWWSLFDRISAILGK